MKVSAGQLDRRVMIQLQAGTIPDESGHQTPNWTDLAQVWAEFTPPSLGREPYSADQYAAFVDAEFTLRYRSDVKLDPAKHRILFDGRVYNILGATETARRETVRVIAKARAEAEAPAA